MDRKTLEKIIDNRLAVCKDTLINKSNGYSRNADMFHNFKVAAAMTGTTPEKALQGMWVKHIVSVFDIINDCPDRIPSKDVLAEKIGDFINYALLLEGMIEERRSLMKEKAL